jgi:hypothetical protein
MTAQVVSHCPVTAEAQVQSQVSLCGIYGGQSGTERGFPPIPSIISGSVIRPCSILIH